MQLQWWIRVLILMNCIRYNILNSENNYGWYSLRYNTIRMCYFQYTYKIKNSLCPAHCNIEP